MNWTGSASFRETAHSPAWSCVTGDLVTSIDRQDNPNIKNSSFCSRRPVSPCGNAGTGRLSLIMGPLYGPYGSERPLNSQPDRLRESSFGWKFPRKTAIGQAGCYVQQSSAVSDGTV